MAAQATNLNKCNMLRSLVSMGIYICGGHMIPNLSLVQTAQINYFVRFYSCRDCMETAKEISALHTTWYFQIGCSSIPIL